MAINCYLMKIILLKFLNPNSFTISPPTECTFCPSNFLSQTFDFDFPNQMESDLDRQQLLRGSFEGRT